MDYNGATICLNGHVISKYSSNHQNYCSYCGKESYSFCAKCAAPIPGLGKINMAVLGDRPYNKSFYCHDCGAAYPWTQKILDNAIELLSLDDEIDNTSKELIRYALPDLLVDTPTTPIATAKYRKGMSKAGQIVKDSMRSLLVDVISETAKKALFP